jgi:hypothetical protein
VTKNQKHVVRIFKLRNQAGNQKWGESYLRKLYSGDANLEQWAEKMRPLL